MREFSFTNAWLVGLRFFSGAALNHAILLIGVGVLLPIAVQVLLLGRPTMMQTSAGAAGASEQSTLVALVTILGFVLQTGSFFASWRLGLGRGETLGGALGFGLLSGLLVCVGSALVLILLAAAFGMIAVPVAVLAVLVAFVGLFAIAWTSFAALLAVGLCLFFVLALAFGTAMGDVTLAATMVGGAGYVWTILIAAALVLLWLAGRLSCAAVLMAERRSFNLIAAIRESWSLTWDDEWRIMRYLALLGLVMAVMVAGGFVAAGAAVGAALAGGSESASTVAAAILFSALSIPLAYLAVLVPVGIYRELAPAGAETAEVFV